MKKYILLSVERYQSLQRHKSVAEKTPASSRTNHTDYGRDLQINNQPEHQPEAYRTEQEPKQTGNRVTATNSGPFKEVVETKSQGVAQTRHERQFPEEEEEEDEEELEEEEEEASIFNKEKRSLGKGRKSLVKRSGQPLKKKRKRNLQHELSSKATGSGGNFWLKL